MSAAKKCDACGEFFEGGWSGGETWYPQEKLWRSECRAGARITLTPFNNGELTNLDKRLDFCGECCEAFYQALGLQRKAG